MKKLLNNPWIVGALALVAVAFGAHSLIPADGGSGVAAVAAGEITEGDGTPGGDAVHRVSETERVREAIKELLSISATRDPFSIRTRATTVAMVQAEKAPPPDLVEAAHLTALWTQSGVTYALINERIVRVGDKLGRLTLEAATQDGVWVTHWKGRDFIALGATFTLTTPALKAAALSLSTDS